MSSGASTFQLPKNYTFTPNGVLMPKPTFERVTKLFQKAENRNPDLHDMYIYNDYFGYGCLELVDETLTSIHTFIAKKKWLEGWYALQALTTFMDMYPDWANVDDGERVIVTIKIYGAMLVAILRALESAKPPLLNEGTIPDLELTLSDMAAQGECHEEYSKYQKVVKGYGRKLFGDRTDDQRKAMREAHKLAYEAFLETLSDKEKEQRGDIIAKNDAEKDKNDEDDDDDDDDDDIEGQPSTIWYGKAKPQDANYQHASFNVTSVWKTYKAYLAHSPRVPLRGPPNWDITKWTAEERKPFAFDYES